MIDKGSTVLMAIIVVLAIGGTLFWVFNSSKTPQINSDVTQIDADDISESSQAEYGEDTVMEEKEVIEKDDLMAEEKKTVIEGDMKKPEALNFAGNVLAGDSSPLIDFNKADYEKALDSDKLVVLYFYANWCPTCKIEVASGLNPAFNSLEGDDIVGFRVSYNDNQTDSNEKDLAKEFGVAYQHTKVFVKDGERILKSPESWSKSRYLSEIDKNK
jgi:thiol-disulfide isomerase/thioredoxin